MSWSRVVYHANCILLLVLCISCGKSTKRIESSSVENGKKGKQASDLNTEVSIASKKNNSRKNAIVTLESIGLQTIDDNIQAEWNLEHISMLAKKRLNELARQLARTHETSHDANSTNEFANKFVAHNYSGSRLVPEHCVSSFQDAQYSVRRSEAKSKLQKTERHGQSGFHQSLHELLKGFETHSSIRTDFKIIGGQLSDNHATLNIRFEQTGKTKDGILQRRATWNSRWQMGEDERLTLSAIRVNDYEESRFLSDQPPLEDRTAQVLAANRSYSDQLLLSTDSWIERLEFRYGIDPGAWLGMAVADVNGDGRDDLYLCQPGGLPNRLYVQNDDGTATDRSADSGVDWLDHCHSALFVDLDNDGDQDLILALKPGLAILQNDGQGSFAFQSIKPVPDSNPYAISAVDYDQDGWLDLYVACYSKKRSQRDRQFIQRPVPYHDANNGGRNLLLQNQRDGTFVDVTKDIGLEQNNRRFSFAASWEDFDNDGDLDLYVANDYGRNNLYRNDSGMFKDVAATSGTEDISAGMSVSWSDYNNDGWMDLYVSNMFSSAGNRIAYQRQFRSSDDSSVRAAFQRHARGNSLFRNSADGTFQDVSVAENVTMGRWAWSSQFVDVNNDGLDDLAIANGFITQDNPADL